MARLLLGVFAATTLGACVATSGNDVVAGIEGERVGRIYHYQRSNSDGTETEQIYMYRESREKLVVYKMRQTCTNAAYVTAELDLNRGIAHRLTGGRLLPDARYENFASLSYDARTQTMITVVPGATPERRIISIPHSPWHLFDFDLASFNAMLSDGRIGRDRFEFGLPLAWADPERDDFIRYLGEVEGALVSESAEHGIQVRTYRLEGSALQGHSGELIVDADANHIIEAYLPIPNHLEYRDFKLALVSIDDGGATAWKNLLTAHFVGCE